MIHLPLLEFGQFPVNYTAAQSSTQSQTSTWPVASPFASQDAEASLVVCSPGALFRFRRFQSSDGLVVGLFHLRGHWICAWPLRGSNETLIRIIGGVGFAITLFLLIQRCRSRAQ